MEPGAEVQTRVGDVAGALARALGDGAVCIAVYGSAASDDFAPGHSDVNLLIVLREVAFADLRLIGATLEREAKDDLRFATPLVITPSFLRDARDSFPIEIDDIGTRHRILHGEDLLSGLAVEMAHLREAAEREARSALLRLRALVMHHPPEKDLQHALAGLCTTVLVIERALLRTSITDTAARGETLFAAVERHQGLSLRVLARLYAMRAGRAPWPRNDDLDDLSAAALRDVEALVAWIDTHAHDPRGANSQG